MLGVLLTGALQRLREQVAAGAAAAGFGDIRMAHQAVMMNVGADGIRITDLADRAQMTKQSMGELVAHLEKGGYVTVEPDPNDRRAKIVSLTARGRATEAPARDSIQRLQEDWSRRLEPGEMDELVRLLRKLNDVLGGPT